jgi:hypothetical protein
MEIAVVTGTSTGGCELVRRFLKARLDGSAEFCFSADLPDVQQ